MTWLQQAKKYGINIPTTPARTAARYFVTLTTGEEFSVFVHRGSVTAERIGKMIAHHEQIAKVEKDDYR